MHDTTGNRELITLRAGGTPVQGTYHRPAAVEASTMRTHADAKVDIPGEGPVGILFVNSLSLPRAASGDSAVRWADALAQKGFPSFRIDLPGIGDSQGAASTDLLDNINAGVFTDVAAGAAKELVDRFSLSGFVLFGHCAGSVSALYGAAASKECKGLVLLDPFFHLPQAKRPLVRDELSDWARRSRVGRLLSNVYDRVKGLLLYLRGGTLPGNANKQLLARWKQVASSGLPILLLQAPGIKAQGSKPRIGEFDYIEYAIKLAGRKSRISLEFVEGADHSFANIEGRLAVQEHMDEWLGRHFRHQVRQLKAEDASIPVPAGNQNGSSNSSPAPANLGCAVGGR